MERKRNEQKKYEEITDCHCCDSDWGKIARDIMKARKQKENIHADTFDDFYEEEMNWWDKDLEEGEE